jgi:uncharacterized repeat protein (TIGR02543 family)
MKVMRKGIILTICLMLVVFLYGEKEKQLTLEQMRAEIASQGHTFTVARTSVSHIPLKKLCGLVEPPDWRLTGKFDGGAQRELTLPSSFDWRDYGKVTPIQNQGSCGSCWAFGTIGSYEMCVAVAGGPLDNLSEEWLLDCNSYGYSCSGGWWAFGDLYDGAPKESCYPYVGSKGTCNTSCPKYHPMDDWYYVGTSSGVPSTTDIKNAIYTYGPVGAAVYVNSYFQNYSGGIFTNTGTYSPNHAIVLVGWNDTGGYWILKNSWGTGWGESGYMRIAYGANNVGYAAAYGIPVSVTPQPPVADFSASPTTVQVGNTVQFTDLSSNSPTSWSWSFEGGSPSSSSAQNPVVTYNSIGTYNVTLTVYNAVGNDTETKVDYITVQEVVLDYCDSSGGNQSYEYIAGVSVGDLSNNSGASGYSDFTYLTAHLTEGSSVGVSLTPGFTGSSYTEYWKIRIDYNIDGDFADSSEEVFSGSGSSTVSGSFTVPYGVDGVTRMRVSMSYSTSPPYCGTFTYGEVEDYTVDISGGVPPEQYTLTTNTVGQGSITLNPPGGTYDEGTVVTLTAVPASGWQFDGWSGDLTGTANPTTITMNADKTVTATFSEVIVPQYTLTVNTVGQGSVALNPPGGTYNEGTVVTLTATPSSGWQFDNWSGDLSGTQNPITITMNDDKTVTANFSEVGTTETFGYTTAFGSTSTSAYRRALPFTMPENGYINSVTMYHTGGSGSVIYGVYDGEGTPQNRIGVTASTTVSSSTGWQTINLTSPAYVAGGSTVWLAWVYQSNPGIRYQTGSPGRYQSSQTWSGGMPDPFGSGSLTNYIYSIYATYTPAGGPTYKNVGYTTVFGSTSTANNRRAQPFTMPEDGTIQSVTMYHTGGSGSMILAVYDGASLPQSRLAVTATTSVSGTTGWQTINLTSPVSVQGGTTIWLAWVYESSPGVMYQTGTPGRAQSTATWSGGMPDPFGSSTTTSYLYSIYATYIVD